MLVAVGVAVGGVEVAVGTGVEVPVGTGVGACVGVAVGLLVGEGEGVAVFVGVGVGVGAPPVVKKLGITCPRLSTGVGKLSAYM